MGCQTSTNAQTVIPMVKTVDNSTPTIVNNITDQKPPVAQQKVVAIANPNSKFHDPQLQKIISKANNDLKGKDPIGKRLYMNQILNYILAQLQKSVEKGVSLFDAEKLVRDDLAQACSLYPISQVQKLQCSIKDLNNNNSRPDLAADIKVKTKENITDRLKQLGLRSKEMSYEFNKEMQIILEKEGGHKFKAGYKYTGTKAYLRIMTKILDQFLDEKLQSKQVYTDLNHYYYTPVFNYFNKIMDSNISNLKIELYDWIRCKCSYRTIAQLEQAYKRLEKVHKNNIFRVKNRINDQTRDILINLKYKSQYTEIQLALDYDSLSYQFQHKLYELTRQKLGIAYSCFTFMLADSNQSSESTEGIMTELGYIKKCFIRQKLDIGYERLTAQDAKKVESLVNLLGSWEVVALKTGKVYGKKHPQHISSELYGPDLQEMVVIKKKSKDPLRNWLNWMD